MSTSIDEAFVKQFEREVHVAYQRQGSKLRGTVRTRNGVLGESTTFQTVGTGTAGTKARHGLVPVMNLDHEPVECVLADYYAGEWVDKLDLLKTNIDERGVVVNAEAYAMGRKTDELLIAAIDDATNTTAITLTSYATVRNSFLEAIEELNSRDVPDDGRRFGWLSPRGWSLLLMLKEFASADYIGPDLPFKSSVGMKSWLGVHWGMHSGLPLATNTRTGFIYHMDAVAHAIGADVQTDISWHGDRWAHFISCAMSQGAVLIDNDGVEELTLDESTAYPTS